MACRKIQAHPGIANVSTRFTPIVVKYWPPLREIAYLLSHLRSVIENLEPSWSKAFLRRTRFLDSDFQGDVLAIISEFTIRLVGCSFLNKITSCRHGLYIPPYRRASPSSDPMPNSWPLCFTPSRPAYSRRGCGGWLRSTQNPNHRNTWRRAIFVRVILCTTSHCSLT